MKKLYVYAIEVNSAGRFLHRFSNTWERGQAWRDKDHPSCFLYIASTHPDVRRVKRRIAQGEIADQWPVKLDY